MFKHRQLFCVFLSLVFPSLLKAMYYYSDVPKTHGLFCYLIESCFRPSVFQALQREEEGRGNPCFLSRFKSTSLGGGSGVQSTSPCFFLCRCWACRQASVSSWWSGEEASSPQVEVLVLRAEAALTSGLTSPCPLPARGRGPWWPLRLMSVGLFSCAPLLPQSCLRSCCGYWCYDSNCFHLLPPRPPFSPSLLPFSLLAPSFPLSPPPRVFVEYLPCVRQLVIRHVVSRNDIKTPDSVEAIRQ